MTTPSLVLAKTGYMYVGGRRDTSVPGAPVVGQMYVEYMIPQDQTHRFPVIMVHGGFETGTNFTGTPDGREGWAQWFARRGYAVYVVDQVARGRSPHWDAVHGAVHEAAYWNATRVEERFSANAKHKLWPQASRHTQFPGTGECGDEVFEEFYAAQYPGITNFPRQQELNRDALVALLDRIGPAVLLVHSQGATFGWATADARPELVKAVLAVEPNGPPVRDIVDGQKGAEWYRDREAVKPYGLTYVPLTYDRPVDEARPLRFVREAEPVAPNLARCWRQADPPAKLERLARIPILILTAEASYHAPYDHCTSAYLSQAGVSHVFWRLEDLGIQGNGHMMMLERNSDEIAQVLHDWLVSNVRHRD